MKKNKSINEDIYEDDFFENWDYFLPFKEHRTDPVDKSGSIHTSKTHRL